MTVALVATFREPLWGVATVMAAEFDTEGNITREWDDTPHSSNVWGILPPRSYFRFDAEAIRYEREGLEAKGQALPPLTPEMMED